MITALNTKVTLKRVTKEKVTTGGIILKNEDNPIPQAVVQSVGPDVKGKIKAGDTIYVDWRYVVQLTADDSDNTYVTDETSVLAVEA